MTYCSFVEYQSFAHIHICAASACHNPCNPSSNHAIRQGTQCVMTAVVLYLVTTHNLGRPYNIPPQQLPTCKWDAAGLSCCSINDIGGKQQTCTHIFSIPQTIHPAHNSGFRRPTALGPLPLWHSHWMVITQLMTVESADLMPLDPCRHGNTKGNQRSMPQIPTYPYPIPTQSCTLHIITHCLTLQSLLRRILSSRARHPC